MSSAPVVRSPALLLHRIHREVVPAHALLAFAELAAASEVREVVDELRPLPSPRDGLHGLLGRFPALEEALLVGRALLVEVLQVVLARRGALELLVRADDVAQRRL